MIEEQNSKIIPSFELLISTKIAFLTSFSLIINGLLWLNYEDAMQMMCLRIIPWPHTRAIFHDIKMFF